MTARKSRRAQVNELLATGLTQSQVARKLGIRRQLVNTYVHYAKHLAAVNARARKKRRDRGAPEKHCSKCGGKGHNTRTCGGSK